MSNKPKDDMPISNRMKCEQDRSDKWFLEVELVQLRRYRSCGSVQHDARIAQIERLLTRYKNIVAWPAGRKYPPDVVHEEPSE